MSKWIKLKFIYKDIEVSSDEDCIEDYQRQQREDDINNAPTVITNRWELREEISGVVEDFEIFDREDVYYVTVFGKAPFYIIIEDVNKFLEEVGPTNAKSENI